MEVPVRRALLIVATILVTAPGPAAAQSADEAEIRSVALRQGDTWSRHDAKAYAALFTEDCDVVNVVRSEEHTSELQSHVNLVCRLLLEKKKSSSPSWPRSRTLPPPSPQSTPRPASVS